MKVALLCRKLEGNYSTGFERYAHELYQSLTQVDVEVIPFNQRPLLGIRSYGSNLAPFYYEVLAPTWRLMRNRGEAEIYHAIADTQGIVFPIVHGKKVVTFHHMVGKTVAGSNGERFFNSYWFAASKIAVGLADKVICISSQTRREMIEDWDVEPTKISVVNHGISKVFRPGHRSGVGSSIGFVGSLNRRKNVETALHVMKSVLEDSGHQCRLKICGEGPDKERLMNLAKDLGIRDSVEFIGRIPENELPDFYRSIDILIFPSFQEGFGFPILEAQACGTPVITLKGAMIPDEVLHSCVRCDGVQGMSDAISGLLNDHTRWTLLSEASNEYASTFTWRRAALETRKVYEEVLDRGN